MKKQNLLVAGILGLMLVFGFVLTACDNGSMPDKYVQQDPDRSVLTKDEAKVKSDTVKKYTEIIRSYNLGNSDNTAKVAFETEINAVISTGSKAKLTKLGIDVSGLPSSTDVTTWSNSQWKAFIRVSASMEYFGN